MDKHSAWTGGQYSLYRALVGLYLVIHFGMLLPYAGELFAVGGAVTAADQSPYFGLLPNPLAWSDSPIAVAGLLLSALAASLLLLIGWRGLVYFWPHPIYEWQLEDASGNKSVLIVPGFMGSQLRDDGTSGDGLIWIDPSLYFTSSAEKSEISSLKLAPWKTGEPEVDSAAGVQVREDGAVLFDFNHPLAGQPVTFEVQLIGVL